MLKLVAALGPGKAIAQYSSTSAETKNLNGDGNDYNELDVLYKFKALGADMLLAYVMQILMLKMIQIILSVSGPDFILKF